MKKFIAVVLILCLLLFGFAYAEKTTITPRGLIEFVQLYMQRIAMAKERYNIDASNIILDFSVIPSFNNPNCVDCGMSDISLTINKDDLRIVSGNICVYDTDDTYATLRGIIAMSALEMDELEALSLEYYFKSNSDNDTSDNDLSVDVILFYLNMYNVYMKDIIENNTLKTGEEKEIYQGTKYNFSLKLNYDNSQVLLYFDAK